MLEINNLQIVLSELDGLNIDNYFPFSEMHCVWEMRCGIYRLFEKMNLYFPDSQVIIEARTEYIQSLSKREKNIKYELNNEKPTLKFIIPILMNANIKKQLVNAITGHSSEIIFFTNNNTIFAKYFPSYSKDISNQNSNNIIYINIEDVSIINYLWDNIYYQSNEIEQDTIILKNKSSLHYTIEDNVYKGVNVAIFPGVILDASHGSIIIEDNVKIMHNSVIIGPCYIGKNSIIKIGAKVYENCSFGPYCKIGGEVEDVIFHGYSNKQHDGFIGHAYIGEWVNFGANTNNSDLKNNYSNIRVNLPHKVVDTGNQFFGFLCGDHSKTAICTAINTGTVIGTCSMIALNKLTPKYIPSFAWMANDKTDIYQLEKAAETAKIVLQRRNKELLKEEENILASIYKKQNLV